MENNILNFIKENISPKEDDILMVSQRYEEVCNIIGNVNTFQSGSYARKTALKPVNDLDIIQILPLDKTIQDAEKALDELYKLLLTYQIKLGVKSIKKQKSSIGLYYEDNEDDFSIDIVPAIETGSIDVRFGQPIYLVPEIQKMNKRKRLAKYKDETWESNRILSAPRSYKNYAKDLDNSSDKNFRYFTKFIKHRRRGAKDRFKVSNQKFFLKSFHMEQICGSIVGANPNMGLFGLIGSFFKGILGIINSKKQFEDLAYIGNTENRRIDEYIEDLEKNTPEFKQWMINEIGRVSNLLQILSQKIDKQLIWNLLEEISSGKKESTTKEINLSNNGGPHGGV